MGMFDNVKCKYLLPKKYRHLQEEVFQTKDFECNLDTYIITRGGNLKLDKKLLKNNKITKVPFHGDFNFYTTTGLRDKNNLVWFEFSVRFTEGKLQWIRGKSRKI